MKSFLASVLLVLMAHETALAQQKSTACPKERPTKSAVVYTVSFEDNSAAVGRIFICSTTPINTEALWVETEAHIRDRKDMVGAISVQITNIIGLRK
jgi:hypothetical protein